MSTHDLFGRLVRALNQAGIPYMFTGSFASSFHGQPRASNDFDIVIASTAEQLRALKELLPESEYYFDLDDALEALKRSRQFNLIDLESGWKIDFIIRKLRPFSLNEFDRRFQIDFEGVSIFLASAEDVILAKLEWAKLASSSRQIEDVAGILKIRINDLDREYIEKWIKDLQVEAQWSDALKVAGIVL
jgi:hypothetical protein